LLISYEATGSGSRRRRRRHGLTGMRISRNRGRCGRVSPRRRGGGRVLSEDPGQEESEEEAG